MSYKADLRLIKVFLTIYESGSVSGAADRLHLTQPSVSYALARLRELLNDPLFTRTREGMQATFIADQHYAIFRESMLAIEKVISAARQFDPAQSTRKFRIAISDLGEFHLLPLILENFMEQAPYCSLEVITIEVDKLETWLHRGKIDAAVCNYSDLMGKVEYRNIFTEKYACLFSQHHPRIKDSISKEQFFNEKHVLIASATGHYLVDEFLKLNRNSIDIALKMPHFSALPSIIPQSEMIACLPSRVAKRFAREEGMKSLPLPVHIPTFEVGLFRNPDIEDTSTLNWFCDLIYNSLKAV